MASHCSVLAWRIPGTVEPGGLPSMGSHRVGHDFMGNRWGNSGNGVRLYFWGAPKSLKMVIAAMKLKDTYSLEGKL